MQSAIRSLIEGLAVRRRLAFAEWLLLLSQATPEDRACAARLAAAVRRQHFGNQVYCRGIVEFTNYCRNNCRYCGIRRANRELARYRLDEARILACCQAGYEAGVRTFVLQGGEDPWFTDDRLLPIVRHIHAAFPEAAITLSLGERSRASYAALFRAGARRYLLRHEAASPALYRRLHPEDQHFWQRMVCLHTLKGLGYQTGCGMMVGAPGQSWSNLAEDLAFMQEFQPEMIGLGPFLPHHATPFSRAAAGDPELTLFLLSLCRLVLPQVLLPATTALRSRMPDGLVRGMAAGCNVIMPNLSPVAERGYHLYDRKLMAGDPGENIRAIRESLAAAGFELVAARGDYAGAESC